MKGWTRLGFLALAAAFGASLGSVAFGQRADVVPLGYLFPDDPASRYSKGQKISGDGTVVLGRSMGSDYEDHYFRSAEGVMSQLVLPQNAQAAELSADGSTVVGYSLTSGRAFRLRTLNSVEFLPDLGTAVFPWTSAHATSADGSVVVGESRDDDEYERPVRWMGGGQPQDLGVFTTDGKGNGTARAVSADGSVVVGNADGSYDGGTRSRAFRWSSTGGLVELGALGTLPRLKSYATDVSADGSIVVGYSEVGTNSSTHAFRWTEATGMVDLTPATDRGSARAISGDGSVILGSDEEGSCIWADGVQYYLEELRERAGIADEWSDWNLTDVSFDGKKFTGFGYSETDQSEVAIVVTLNLEANRRPTIESVIAEGGSYSTLVGEPFAATFIGRDPDQGDRLTLDASDLPPGATVSPTIGTTAAPPLAAELNWTPTADHFGISRDVTIRFTDVNGNFATRTFTLSVPANDPPAIMTPAPVSVECLEGLNLVELKATVTDPEGHPLSVVWRIDGTVQKTQNAVASGAEVSFSFNYPHGSHVVQIEASDGARTATAGTTVTVEDTTAPIVVVAADVIVRTDAGKAFATGVSLPPPSVTDNCDGVPTLTHDAPSVFPLGTTTVAWTATDADGNVAVANQSVVVQDREAPQIVGSSSIRAFVDRGRVFARLVLPQPEASDNVPTGLTVTSDAPRKFPIGTTPVVWTARDAAGNEGKWKSSVRVVNRAPVADAGKNLRVTASSSEGAMVKLNGRKSNDPDGHALKYKWAAGKVKLQRATTATPKGLFPVGTTRVVLTVTDEAGAKATKAIKVTVKLNETSPRPNGVRADAAFAAASRSGLRNLRGSSTHDSALAGYQQTLQAAALGLVAGDEVAWAEADSAAEALVRYGALRQQQAVLGRQAAVYYLNSYLESGDEDGLEASLGAAAGAWHATAEFSER